MTKELSVRIPVGIVLEQIKEEPVPERLAEVQALLDSSNLPLPWIWRAEVLALDEDDCVVGAVVSSRDGELTIVVVPNWQRQGIGTAMLQLVENKGEWFHVVAGSEAGAALLFHFFDRYEPQNIEWESYKPGAHS